MDILSAVVAGIIQGFTEFLPISSSGHLALYHIFFGYPISGDRIAFDVFLHLGTLLAVCAVYRKDVIDVIRGFFTGIYKIIRIKPAKNGFDKNEKLAFFIAAATLPLVIAAIIGADGWADAMSRRLFVVGAALILNGFILLLSEHAGKGSKTLSDMKTKNALCVGLCQAIAVVPGLSRSGSTVSSGLLQGFDRESAVKFSFLISIPAIAGANILKLPDLIGSGAFGDGAAVYISGIVSAALSGFAAIKLLTYTVKKAKFRYFSYYCFIIGVTAVICEIFTVK